MATPRFIARRVGDQYVLVPANRTTIVGGQPAWLAGGVMLAMVGVMRRGIGRWGLLLLGGALVAAGLGSGGAGRRRAGRGDRRTAPITRGPSFPRDPSSPDARGQRPQDAVDEASMESFPASDAPAHMTPGEPV